jgi:NADH pyrophosphatase NudC (nudix superfamily)
MTTTQAPRFCECGCGEPVARRFRPGHDARLKGRLLAATRSAVWQQREAAIHAMIERGWGHFVDIETLACTPKRGSWNINNLVAWHVDMLEVGHAHRFCDLVSGPTQMAEVGGQWSCPKCVHTTELVEDVWRPRMLMHIVAEGAGR